MNKKQKLTRKRGNKIGFRFFEILIRTTGINSAYSFLKVVAMYYLIFDREAVKNAKAYLERRFPNCSKLQIYKYVYKLFISQGKQLIDRYTHLAKPDFFKFNEFISDDVYKVLQQKEQGFIILTSHFGNWQIGLGALKILNLKKINFLMKPEDNVSVKKTFKYHNKTDKYNFIFSNEEFGGILELTKALQKGEIVSIMGDRTYGSKSNKVSFLNDTAEFPITAFHLALTMKCPIIFLFVIKSNTREYDVHMKSITITDCPEGKTKRGKIEFLQSKYVKELEGFADKYPYQCFIFEDIWKTE